MTIIKEQGEINAARSIDNYLEETIALSIGRRMSLYLMERAPPTRPPSPS